MASPQPSAIIQSSAIFQSTESTLRESRLLIEEMRQLRAELRRNVDELHTSASQLKTNMALAMVGTRRISSLGPADNANNKGNNKDAELLTLLTAREREVLKLIGEGNRTKEIAYLLDIAVKTAVTHRANIMEKLGIHEGPMLVRFAIRAGICKA